MPFHKLSQWLCYSLMQPMSKLMNIHFAGAELMTGLPEYRNGGLFIDTGVLSLKMVEEARGLEQFRENSAKEGKSPIEVVPMFSPDDDVIVEWRAVTVGFLDLLLEEVNKALALQGNERLTLPQMLEAGSWKVCSKCLPLSILYKMEVLTRHREVAKWLRFAVQTHNARLSLFSRTELSSRHLLIPYPITHDIPVFPTIFTNVYSHLRTQSTFSHLARDTRQFTARMKNDDMRTAKILR